MTTANPTTSTTGSESCNAMTGEGAGDHFDEDLHERQARKAAQALRNATSGQSFMNYEGIYSGFQAMGIPADDIKPRVNVFTFNAWKPSFPSSGFSFSSRTVNKTGSCFCT